jgi:O-antigen/teichoic acid export membrane protein
MLIACEKSPINLELSQLNRNMIWNCIQIGTPLTLHAVVGILHAMADRFVLAQLLSQEQVAVYHFAAVQGSAVFFALNIMAMVFVPIIYRSDEYNVESDAALASFFTYSVICGSVLSLTVYFIVFPLSLSFVHPVYQEGNIVLLFNLANVLLSTIGLYALYMLTLLKRVLWVPIIGVLGVAINLIINYSLIPVYGIEGAAFAGLISHVISGISLLLVAKYEAIIMQKCR